MTLEIDKKEVLRYLGYKGQGMDSDLESQVDLCIEEVKTIATPRFTYQYFELGHENGLTIKKGDFIFLGQQIKNHLKDAKVCVIMAVTLGIQIEMKLRQYQSVNLTKALILDACATTAVEFVCDVVEEEIRQKAKKDEKAITFRFSPGYGDFPITVQKQLLNLLETQKKIGLTVNDSHILMPRKSVTAVIGIVNKGITSKKSDCTTCQLKERCEFRKNGAKCNEYQ